MCKYVGVYGCLCVLEREVDHQLGGLNNTHLFFTVLEVESLRSRCWQIQCLRASSWLANSTFCLCPHMAERERGL